MGRHIESPPSPYFYALISQLLDTPSDNSPKSKNRKPIITSIFGLSFSFLQIVFPFLLYCSCRRITLFFSRFLSPFFGLLGWLSRVFPSIPRTPLPNHSPPLGSLQTPSPFLPQVPLSTFYPLRFSILLYPFSFTNAAFLETPPFFFSALSFLLCQLN